MNQLHQNCVRAKFERRLTAFTPNACRKPFGMAGVSKSIIDGNETGPSHGTIAYRFGGLVRAYKLIGHMSNWYGERHARPHYVSDDEMLDALRKLWRDQGYLSQKLIRKVTSVPSCYEYCKRFGALSAAYALIGFTPTSPPSRRQPFVNRE